MGSLPRWCKFVQGLRRNRWSLTRFALVPLISKLVMGALPPNPPVHIQLCCGLLLALGGQASNSRCWALNIFPAHTYAPDFGVGASSFLDVACVFFMNLLFKFIQIYRCLGFFYHGWGSEDFAGRARYGQNRLPGTHFELFWASEPDMGKIGSQEAHFELF